MCCIERQPQLLILDFAGANFVPATTNLQSLVELARAASITPHVFADDVMSIAKDDLLALLENIHHYEFRIIDLPRVPTSEESNALYCHYGQDGGTGSPLGTANFPLSSSFYLHSHDDCYMLLESRDVDLPIAIIEKTLRTYANTALAEIGLTVQRINSVPRDLLNNLLAAPDISILRHHTNLINRVLNIGFSRASFNFREPADLGQDGQLELDIDSGAWRLKP